MPVDSDGRLIPPPPIPKAPEEEEVNESNRGSLAPQAASILMKLLYAARIRRFDLLRSILFADADYAGCGESLKSTSGAHMHIQGPHTRISIGGTQQKAGVLKSLHT